MGRYRVVVELEGCRMGAWMGLWEVTYRLQRVMNSEKQCIKRMASERVFKVIENNVRV